MPKKQKVRNNKKRAIASQAYLFFCQ